MTENETVQQEGTLGVIDISTTAVTTIASQSINQCYGVVGMANKNLANGLANLLSRDSKRGIEVAIDNGEITIDVYVIVEYGVNIRAVAESIQHTVKFHVEKALNMPVNAINVYVQGLRMGKENS